MSSIYTTRFNHDDSYQASSVANVNPAARFFERTVWSAWKERDTSGQPLRPTWQWASDALNLTPRQNTGSVYEFYHEPDPNNPHVMALNEAGKIMQNRLDELEIYLED
ncbi:uncharacterized protein I206_101149 [Kwoniella pini CBS 10737]|uniref:Uncharacterized protein n=1 Tax=Kwoniella pini CBS 10737 TaxID=1296096 RepID=A0AAJ8KZC6_9TREE